MEKLLERLTTLHKFNEQFAEENEKLRQQAQNLDERIVEMRKQIASCDNCQRLSQALDKNVQLNKTLANDVAMMKTLVYRLNVQIESYQDQIRKGDKIQTSSSNCEHASNVAPWCHDEMLHTHTLGPLLKSYDEMINDKQELIQQYKQEFELFTGELKHVLEENNKLMEQTEQLKRDCGTWREERTRLQAQVDVCRAKAEAQTRKCDLAKEKLVEVMHCYEQKMQALVLDQEHLQSAYSRCKTELAALKSATSQPQNVIASSLQECKELLEQLRQQHSKEKQQLEQQIALLKDKKSSNDVQTCELQLQNTALKKEVALQKESFEELQRKIASLQRNCDKVKRSRDRLKARLRIALQWAQKLEEGQANIQNTWDALKRLETIVKHKESQVRGLHARHLQEIDKMQKKLTQKEETIRTILKGKLEGNNAATAQ